MHKDIAIGRRIKELRKSKKLTQGDFAEKIGRDRSLVSKLETGEVELSNTTRQAICKAFAVRQGWLLDGRGGLYDDRWDMLEKRAEELGEDIALKLRLMKAAGQAHQELLKTLGAAEDMVACSKFEKEHINKLLQIFRYKDEETIAAIIQNIDTLQKVPDKEPGKKNAKKRA